jgi:hypothetical protein
MDSRLLIDAPGASWRKRPAAAASTPLYSRVEVAATTANRPCPFAELELPSGVKLRLYAQTQEMLGLLSSMCVSGGER